ncbi:MAG: hypothetical protein WDM92_08355 [Caulobacteraceae bacterium]
MARHIGFQDLTEAEFLKQSEVHVEAMNHALRNVPAEQCRYHICWGNYEGPHDHDIPVERIMDIILKARPQAVLFEAANARHQHEVDGLARRQAARGQGAGPRNDRLLLQLRRASRAGRPDRRAVSPPSSAGSGVIAGTDCGFGTFAGYGKMDMEISYKKLRSLSEGAAIASERLWRRAA